MTMRPMLVLLAVCFAVLVPRRARGDDDDLAFSPAWLSVGGAVRDSRAREDVAVFAELGMAFDAAPRARPPLALSEALAAASTSPAPLATAVPLPISPRVVRSAIHAAYRAARFLTDDSIDGLASRARWSGLVPELRVGARRVWDDTARLDVTSTD